MRPILCALKICWESLSTPMATFSKICNGLLFRSILWICVQNLKSVAFPVPGIIGGNQNIWAVPVYAHAPFSPKFFNELGLLFGWTLWMDRPNLKSVALLVPEIIINEWMNEWIAFEVLGGGCDLRTPNIGEDEAVGGRWWYDLKEHWWVPIYPPL